MLVPYFSLTKASTLGNLRKNTSMECALSNGFDVAAGMELKSDEEQVIDGLSGTGLTREEGETALLTTALEFAFISESQQEMAGVPPE